VDASLILQQPYIAFADDAFGVLPVPSFGGIQQQVEVERLYLFGILEVRFEKAYKVVPEQQPVFIKKPGKPDMGERTYAGEKPAVFAIHFKVHQVPKLQNRMPCTVKTVVGANTFLAQYHGNGVLILGFFNPQYKSSDSISFFEIVENYSKKRIKQHPFLTAFKKKLNNI
jgi:hypothetical protein